MAGLFSFSDMLNRNNQDYGLYSLRGKKKDKGLGADILAPEEIAPNQPAPDYIRAMAQPTIKTQDDSSSIFGALTRSPGETGMATGGEKTGTIKQLTQPTQPEGTWNKKIIGNMTAGGLVSALGTLAYITGPKTEEGKAGLAIANMARQNMQQEEKQRAGQKPIYTGEIKSFHDIYGRAPTSAEELKTFKEAITVGQKPTYTGDMKSFVDIYGRKPTSPQELKTFKEQIGVDKEEKLTKVEDNKGNISWFRGSELISGSGKGKATKEPDGKFHYSTDNEGNVSVYESGKLISGTGKGKAKEVKEVKGGDIAVKAAKLLREAQYDKKGELYEKVNDSDIFSIKTMLEGSPYEIVQISTPAEKKTGWFGLDALSADIPQGQPIWTLQKKKDTYEPGTKLPIPKKPESKYKKPTQSKLTAPTKTTGKTTWTFTREGGLKENK